MNIRSFFTLIILLNAVLVFAQKNKAKKDTPEQNPSGNLIPNSGFEDADFKALKGYGLLTTLCPSWTSPNEISADLFKEGVKSTKIGIPANDFGVQEAQTGSAYSGFTAFTKDPKKNRSYLQVQLNKPLEKDQLYCVKINISLADLSKYAVNNVGVFLSNKKISHKDNYALTFQPQILEKMNKPVTMMDGWQTICGTFIGTGEEQYAIIGGFGEESKMKTEKVKKPAGITGSAINGAYYYLDNVEIIPITANSQCSCTKADERQPELIYSRSAARGEKMTPQQIIGSSSVYYAFLSTEVHSMFETELAEVVELLKSNPNINIELAGHSNTEEISEAKLNDRYSDLALKRADALKKFLVDAGISESRITVSSKEDTSPASTMNTPMAKAQNRRVEILVK
ncbi:MAG: OmpA family protein [Crocinitomicaceae bacterium]|nr:OmpA family protein [Crocinitomicaceae bacterium]